jgi:hypothetical protein
MFEDKVLERDDFAVDQAESPNPSPPRAAMQPRMKPQPPGNFRHRASRTKGNRTHPASSTGTACWVARLSRPSVRCFSPLP